MHELSPIRRPSDGRLPLSRLASGYLADYLPRVTATTYEREQRFLDTWLALLGDIDGTEITRPMVIRARSQRLRGGAAVSSVNAEVGAIRRVIGWAVDNGYLESNPLLEIKKIPVRDRDLVKKRRALTEEEVARLIKAAQDDDADQLHRGNRNVPQAPMLLTFLYSGARRGELLATRWRHWSFDVSSDVLEGAAEVRLTVTKSGKERIVPVPAECAKAVLGLIPYHEKLRGRPVTENDLVFLSARGKPYHGACNPDRTNRLLRQWLKLAGIPRIVDGYSLDLHALRTTYATRMAEAGVELGERQALLGHSDPRVTERHYTRRSARHHHKALARLLEMAKAEGLDAEKVEALIAALEAGSPMGPGEPTQPEGGDAGPHSPIQQSQNRPAMASDAGLGKNLGQNLARLAEVFMTGEAAAPAVASQPENPAPAHVDTVVVGGDSSANDDYGTRSTAHKTPPSGNPNGGYRAPLLVQSDALPLGETLTIIVVGTALPKGDPNHDSEHPPRG
jgi:integrase/recombinase XerD